MAPELQWRQPHVESCNGAALAAAGSRRRGGKERQEVHVSRRCVLGVVVLFAASMCLVRMALLLSVSLAGRENPVQQVEPDAEWSNAGLQQQTEEDDAEQLKDEVSRGNATQENEVRVEDDRRSEAETNSTANRDNDIAGPYHSPRMFFEDYSEMLRQFKVFVYPCAKDDPFENIFLPVEFEPSGNYASESYFKKALASSSLITTDPTEADLFYMPFSIARLRHDPRVGVGGIKGFIRDYVLNISQKWPYWNRTGGSDHFYVACHSVTKFAMDEAVDVRLNAIQVLCSSSYYLQGFIPHKDVPIPQIWPRKGNPLEAATTSQRKTLAFFAGEANSPVRNRVVETWKNDSAIQVYAGRISTPYSEALLGSKFCLHVKGYEVNTARIGDAFYYGCVPVVIANHYDLPFNNVLSWKSFSFIVTTADIPKLKSILSEISSDQYMRMQKLVMDVRKHFQWHAPPEEYDAFYMVMYQLWLRRHIVRPGLGAGAAAEQINEYFCLVLCKHLLRIHCSSIDLRIICHCAMNAGIRQIRRIPDAQKTEVN